MTQCAICTVAKAEWFMKARYGVLDQFSTKTKKKICNVCYKRINPEGRERIEMQEDEKEKEVLRLYIKYEEQSIPGFHMEDKVVEAPMILHFRKIRRN